MQNYEQLIAAQNEAGRRLQISSIETTLDEERRKRSNWAIFTGVCCAGVVASTMLSGINPDEALKAEIAALSSFDSLKEYLTMLTPAMYATMGTAVLGVKKIISHNREFNKAAQQYADINSFTPESIQDEMEQSKTR